jgi:hypothetical protein
VKRENFAQSAFEPGFTFLEPKIFGNKFGPITFASALMSESSLKGWQCETNVNKNELKSLR